MAVREGGEAAVREGAGGAVALPPGEVIAAGEVHGGTSRPAIAYRQAEGGAAVRIARATRQHSPFFRTFVAWASANPTRAVWKEGRVAVCERRAALVLKGEDAIATAVTGGAQVTAGKFVS